MEFSKDTAAESGITTPPDLQKAILEVRQPFDVDWRMSAHDMDEHSRLLRLARVRAVLPEDNDVEEKSTHDKTIENYIKLALEAAGDRQTLDTYLRHVSNMLELQAEGVQELAGQVLWIWAPAAGVAGLYQHKSALEEAAFDLWLPEASARVREQYDKTVLEGERGLLVQTLERLAVVLDISLDGDVSYSMSARSKGNYSTWRKLEKAKKEHTELFDLLGFRVVIEGEESEAIQQCYAAMVAITSEFESDETKLKDYISKPKASGYQSIHLVLYNEFGFPFEVQIRTRDMDHATEADRLSHQLYEATYKKTPGKIQRTFRKVPKLYSWRADATCYINDSNGQTEGILDGDLLFFRPDGNLYLADAGSNALDASFRIHNRRALRTGQIRINGKLSRVTDPISHGDLIEVQYNPTYSTDRARFDTYSLMVTTSDARKAVESARRRILSDHYRQLGHKRVLELVGVTGLDDPISVLDPKDRRELADKAGVPSFDRLLELIGTGEASGKPGRVARYIKERCGLSSEVIIKSEPEPTGTMEDSSVLQELVIPSIGGKLECHVAGCCSEKIRHGDPVLVRPSRIDDIAVLKVHRIDCVNILDTSDTIMCSWKNI